MSELILSVTVSASKTFPDHKRLLAIVDSVFDGEGLSWRAISVVLTDHATVLELNSRWLDHDFHTDVISFLLEENPEAIEGEVYVDVETAMERHEEFDSSLRSEIERYVVHGLLHIVGYDDETDQERLQMRRLEDKYLAI